MPDTQHTSTSDTSHIADEYNTSHNRILIFLKHKHADIHTQEPSRKKLHKTLGKSQNDPCTS